MAIVPVHSRRPIPDEMLALLARLPDTWVDDGLSCFPDSILGWNISWCGTVHDARGCTRLWAPGSLDLDARRHADRELRQNVWAALPFGLRTLGYAVFIGVHVGNNYAFDSCGLKPHYANASQKLAGLCRHGVGIPQWLRGE